MLCLLSRALPPLRRASALLLLASLVLLGLPAPQARAALPTGFSDTVVFRGLKSPTALAFAPDGRVFVAEKAGIVKVFDGLGDTSPTEFANLSDKVHSVFDRGMLGLAVPPDFPQNPYVYVAYAHDAPIGGTAPVYKDTCANNSCHSSGRLSRLKAAGNTMTGAEQVLIEDWCADVPYHTVGALRFGQDGSLYMSGGDGAGGGSTGGDSSCGDPKSEGGSLRAQDLRTTGDPVGLGGTIIRVDPNTGLGMADNPLASSSDPNAKRIVAYGFRNPFRFALRPGTSQLWVGDVGWQNHEEFNRVPNVAGSTKAANFGWPCYEGTEPQPGFQAKNLPICQQLYAEPGAATPPALTYAHGGFLFADDHCGELPADDTHDQPYAPDEGAASAVAFYSGGDYPDAYDGALFLGDYARGCMWVVRAGAGGEPDLSTIQPFASDIGPIVDLQTGPNGDLFYVNIYAGTVRRIAYGSGGTTPPPPPPSADAPTATISAPTTSTTTWAVGDSISFAGSARDVSGAAIPASGLSWSVVLHHCYTAEQCHEHPYQTFDGIAQGSFAAPDHEYPAFLELRLDATDSAGRTGTASTRLEPKTVDLSFASEPAGLALVVGGAAPAATPFTLRSIVGSAVAVSAPSPQESGGATHAFGSWSDGGEQSHTITAPASPASYQVTFQSAGGGAGGLRLAGGSREETAAAVSRSTFAAGAPVAYVARSDDYPDALAGGPAAARLGGPILLVSSDSVPAATAAELERLRPQRIVLLGGTQALSEAVRTGLQRYTTTPIERVAGSDRYATAALVSQQVFPAGTPVAYVATGERFPDALAGGAAAAAAGAPVLLVRHTSIPDQTAAELGRLRPGRIVVLGGTGAVSAEVESALRGLDFIPAVERRQGPERYATAAAISAGAFPEGVDTVYLATGRGFADALSAVPAAGTQASPVLLVDYDSLPAPVASELQRLAPSRVIVLGGELAVAPSVQNQAQAYLRR